jgi:hypothetical protein
MSSKKLASESDREQGTEAVVRLRCTPIQSLKGHEKLTEIYIEKS